VTIGSRTSGPLISDSAENDGKNHLEIRSEKAITAAPTTTRSMARHSYTRLALVFTAFIALTCHPLQARNDQAPTDQGGRPIRDSGGELINYGTPPAAIPTPANGSLYLNTGGGTLNPGTSLPPLVVAQSPEWQYSVFGTAIGSSGILIVENGGKREICLGGSARGGFSGDDFWQVLRWDAATANYEQVWVSQPFSSTLVSLALGNVTGNADKEIVTAAQNGLVTIHKLSDKSIIGGIALGATVKQMRLADLDFNGTDEIIITTDSDLRVYSPTGALLWSVTGAGGYDLAIANMDGDSGLEIATTSGKVVDATTHAIQWTYANGFGYQLRAADVDNDGRAELISSAGWYAVNCYDVDTKLAKWSIKTDLDIGAIEVANVDSDPLPELLIGDGQWGEIHAYELSTQTQQWQIQNPEHGTTQVAVGDVDMDGKLDVLWGAGATSTGEDHLYVADIATLTRKWENVHLDGPFLSPVVGDLDGDGRLELVTCSTESDAGYSSGRILVFDAETRKLRGISDAVSGNLSWTGVRDIKLRDINGDGALEIVIATDRLYDGVLEIYGFGKQNIFTKKWTNAVRPSGTFTRADVVDIDGDGNLEVVAVSDAVRFYDLASAQLEWQSAKVGNGITDMVIADFDQDGRLEVLALSPSLGITSFDGRDKVADGQITGSFSALSRHATGFGFWIGANNGVVTSYSRVGGAYVPGTSWTVSSSRIDGITPDQDAFWASSAGQVSRYRLAGGLDWASVDFGDSVSPRVGLVDLSSGQNMYLGTLGTLAGFRLSSPKPTVSLTGSGTLLEGSASTVNLTVALDRASASPLTVELITSGTATATDFTVQGAQPGAGPGQWTVQFATGEMSRTITVGARDDSEIEETKQLTFTLASSASYVVGQNNSVSLPIEDDEYLRRPTVSIDGSGPLAEGGNRSRTLTLILNQDPVQTLPVEISASGTADLSDFQLQGVQAGPGPGRFIINFEPGERLRTITVTAPNDRVLEATEQLTLTLVPALKYAVGLNSSATIEIADFSTVPKPVVSLSGIVQIPENGGQPAFVTLSLDAPLNEPLTVHLEILGDAAPTDYQLNGTSTVTLAPGEVSRTLTITAIDDMLPEANEQVVLSLQPSDDYVIANLGVAIVTIVDNEWTVSVHAEDAEAREGRRPRLNDPGVFVLQRTGSLDRPLAVTYSVVGTASSDSDYQALPGVATFDIGQNRIEIPVIPRCDRVAEPTEFVVLSLLPSPEHRIDPGASSAAISIIDDEPTITATGAKVGSSAWGSYVSFTFTRVDADQASPLTATVRVTRSFADGTRLIDTGTIRFAAKSKVAKLTMSRHPRASGGSEDVTVTLLPSPRYHLGESTASSIVLPAAGNL
jgi:hypothetical protein